MPKVVSQRYSMWNRKYWFYMLLGSSVLYLAYHAACAVALDSGYALFRAPVLLAAFFLLLGALTISLPVAYPHSQALVSSAVALALACEISMWKSEKTARLSSPFLAAYVGLLCRLTPKFANSIGVAGLFWSFIYAGVWEVGFNASLLTDQLILCMSVFFCSLGAGRSFELQTALCEALTDHLLWRKSSKTSEGEFVLYGASSPALQGFVENSERVVHRKFSSREMEDRYKKWTIVQREEFFTKHSFLTALQMVLLVLVFVPYQRFSFSSPVCIVQLVCVCLLIFSLVGGALAKLTQSSWWISQARLGFLTGLGFLMAAATFSAVFAVTAKSASSTLPPWFRTRELSTSNMQVDAWLFTEIASFVVVDNFPLVIISNAVILGSGLLFFKFWALTASETVLIYGTQYLLLFALLLTHRVCMENAARGLFAFSDVNRRSGERTVKVTGIQTHMSRDRVLYIL
ncbi:MAG: hypothetical protein EBZ48_16040, partial [Proteobacteria bacterium]|nr:hypothetical protein [Pseudomonadota bacterium]